MSVKIDSLLATGMYEENSFIITDIASGKRAIIDPCFENFDMNSIGDDFEYILLTHGHMDHIAQALDLKAISSAKIVAHSGEKEVLQNTSLNLTNMIGKGIKIVADIYVGDGDSLPLGESVIKAMHTPGHTSGSVCYIVNEHMFTGDTVMKGTIGRCDLPTGNLTVMMKSIEKIKSLETNYNLYCGHEDNTTLDEERKNNEYFNM